MVRTKAFALVVLHHKRTRLGWLSKQTQLHAAHKRTLHCHQSPVESDKHITQWPPLLLVVWALQMHEVKLRLCTHNGVPYSHPLTVDTGMTTAANADSLQLSCRLRHALPRSPCANAAVLQEPGSGDARAGSLNITSLQVTATLPCGITRADAAFQLQLKQLEHRG